MESGMCSTSKLLPCVVFISCSPQLDNDKLLSLVVGENRSSSSGEYIWNIDTKYYEAEVKLLFDGVERPQLLNEWDAHNSLDGLVLYYGGNFSSAREAITTTLNSVANINSDVGVKILVCDNCDSVEERTAAEEWCVNESFEHLELSGPEGDENRLTQALEAHVWPNLVHKSANSSKKKSKTKKSSQDDSKSSKEDDDLDDFSTLFSQLATMKEQASCLAPEDRKAFAEQVVLAYWRSIGGNDDELLDL